MDLVVLVLIVALIGFLVYVITTQVPMPPGWRTVIQVVALILLIVWLLSRFGLVPNVLPR